MNCPECGCPPDQPWYCGCGIESCKVEVTARYTDCLMWRCPGCKILVDDRKPPWGIRHYYELDEHGREVGR